jgi:hypothetical protein
MLCTRLSGQMRHKANENLFGARLVGCCGLHLHICKRPCVSGSAAAAIKAFEVVIRGRSPHLRSSNFVNGAARWPHHPWIKRALLWSLSYTQESSSPVHAVCPDAVTWSNRFISSPWFCALFTHSHRIHTHNPEEPLRAKNKEKRTRWKKGSAHYLTCVLKSQGRCVLLEKTSPRAPFVGHLDAFSRRCNVLKQKVLTHLCCLVLEMDYVVVESFIFCISTSPWDKQEMKSLGQFQKIFFLSDARRVNVCQSLENLRHKLKNYAALNCNESKS